MSQTVSFKGDMDDRKTAMETTKVPYFVQNFMNFGPQTLKIGPSFFTL